MGWLRKIGRKIDRGVRKVFGKNGWFKAAATVAALAFVAPIFGTGTMSFRAAVPTAKLATAADSAALQKIPEYSKLLEEAKSAKTIVPTESTVKEPLWTSMTESTKDYLWKKGQQIKELPQTLLEQGQTLVSETADKAVKAEIIERAMGDEQFEGSTKGVQEIASSETALVQDALTYSFNNPQDMPSLSVTLADPVFAKWSNIAS